MANSLHFNSVDCSGSSYNLTVLKNDWAIAAPQQVSINAVPFGAGTSWKNSARPRDFVINCYVFADTRANLFTKLDNLAVLISQSTEKSLRFDDFFSTRYWLVRYTGGLENLKFDGTTGATFALQFTAADPFAYSTTSRTTPNVTITGTGQTFNIESASVVSGTWYTKPIWILKATNGATNPSIVNNTTAETLTWTGSLSSGHWLRINSSTFRVDKSTNAGSSYTDSMTGVSGSFPRLIGGVQNSITVAGLTNGATLTLTYTPRFI